MTFKKKVIAFGVSCVLVFVAIVASMVAIFANNNMLVETNVMLTYSGELTNAFISINKWNEGETNKTSLLSQAEASGISETVVNSVTEELTENVTYFVLEYLVINASTSNYYAQFTYTDADSDDSNIKFRWCVSVGAQLTSTTLLQQTFNEEYLYWKGDTTQIIGNVTLAAKELNSNVGRYTYIYIICGIEDLSLNAKFTGSLNWNVSVAPFEEVEQINLFKEGGNYYTYLGRMPQTYAGTALTNVTLLSEVYTESGVEYEMYIDRNYNRYVKKGDAYYKYERIKWRVLGVYYYSSQTSNSSTSQFKAYTSANYTSKSSTNLVLISTKILFKSQWNESLIRVNYLNSTIHTKVLDFYNNVLSDYSSIMTNYSSNWFYYNNAESSTQTSLVDSTNTYVSHKGNNIWLFTTSQVNGWFNTAVKKQTYSTAWVNGTTGEQLDSWWLRTNQYNVENEVEIFKANSVGVGGVLVGADITETKGVRPAMVVNLP